MKVCRPMLRGVRTSLGLGKPFLLPICELAIQYLGRRENTRASLSPLEWQFDISLMMMSGSMGRMVVALLLILAFVPFNSAIYCDDDDCYDLLGLTQSATTADVKKAYYKLSLKYHPDKNPDPEARKFFVKIANAYEILKDENTRDQYDYAIAHPEQVFYNTARYYQAYYGPETDLRLVIAGLLVFLSGFQYLNQWTRYTQMVNKVKQTPAYKNKLKALEMERNGTTRNKKKASKTKNRENSEEDVSKELELQIHGAEKPNFWSLLGTQILLLPYIIGKLIIWEAGWIWSYHVRHLPYAWNDAVYMTQTCLGIPRATWMTMSKDIKDPLVHKRLWIRANLDKYKQDLKKEVKRRR